MSSRQLIRMRGIVKRFYVGQPNELEILHGIDLDVNEGEFVSIVGASGSGKSTLMNMIGVLDRPTEGTYWLDGTDVQDAQDDELADPEPQNRLCVPELQPHFQNQCAQERRASDDVRGTPAEKRTQRAEELLDLVGMADRMLHQPNELSGGQKQRVAIARAMANDPAIILADEPTGALDSKTGRMVMDLFHRLNREQGKTIVLITHNQELAAETSRVLTMRDGILYTGSERGAREDGTR